MALARQIVAMNNVAASARSENLPNIHNSDLVSLLSRHVIEQLAAMQLQAQASGTRIIIITGGGLAADELAICEERESPILYKPFRPNAVLNLVRGQYRRALAAASS